MSINLAFVDSAEAERWREIPAELNIHPSNWEIYLAAVSASLAGWFANYAGAVGGQLNGTLPQIGWLSALATVLLAFFITVIAQRRTEIQFGFAIEDWAGGAIVGFLVGYLGNPFINAVLKGVSGAGPP